MRGFRHALQYHPKLNNLIIPHLALHRIKITRFLFHFLRHLPDLEQTAPTGVWAKDAVNKVTQTVAMYRL